jgi:hypothetical protein
VAQVVGYAVGLAVWDAGLWFKWHVEQTAVDGCVKVDGVHAGYLWHCSQVVGYFCVLAVCVVGLFERWHVEQLLVTPVCEYFTVAHNGYVWQFWQTVG